MAGAGAPRSWRCPGFDAHKVQCDYHDYREEGCASPSSSVDRKSPALSIDESRCIRVRSCDDLAARGVCERAQKATAYTQTSQTTAGIFEPTQTTGSTSTHAPVCP